jgi:hypothetical protein
VTRSREAYALPPALQLRPASTRSQRWTLVLAALLPMGVGAAIAVGALAQHGSLALDPGLLAVLVVTVLLPAALAMLLFRLMRRHRLEMDADALSVVTTFYRRRLPYADLDLANARVLELDEQPGFKPLLKTNAMMVPGFHSGSFRLRNWKSAFVAISDGRRVLWLPTRRAYSLLLQPEQPQALLDHLRELAGRQGAR